MGMRAEQECQDGTCTCGEDEQFTVSPEAVNRNRVTVGLPAFENPNRVTVHRHA